MLIAIATDGGYVSAHFGRCEAYTMVDIQNRKLDSMDKVDNPGHAPGAIPEFLHKKGVKKIVCGGIGARATEMFEQYGIEISAGIEGTIENVIQLLKEGSLTGKESLCMPGAGRGYGIEKTVCNHAHEES